MSFNEVLAELPGLTVGQRQQLVRRALELDEPGLADEQVMIVEERLAEHRIDPASALSLEAMKERLRGPLPK
jgi:hypothetical protein